MTTIGYATLQIVPSLRGVSASINKQLAGMPDVGTNAGKQIGSNIAAGIGVSGVGRKIGKDLESGVSSGAEGAAGQVKSRLSERLGAEVGTVVGRGVGAGLKGGITVAAKAGELALKGALIGAAGAASVAVGGVGLALTKGFDRLKSIDEAKFKLGALGNDAANVAKIMDSALASVKGTAFGMDEAVTAAASAVAAGIKPGQDLTKYLGEVGDAAAIAGTSFTDMGSIFNKIQTNNKAYTDDLQQLSDRGIPIFQYLQKEYGVTADALSKMVQDGDVDAAHFQAAIENNIGGAAQKMGQSFQGSVQNAEAALGRLGAALLQPLFGQAAGGVGSLTEGLDKLTGWVQAHQPEIISFFTDMGITAVEVAQNIVQAFGQILQGVGEFTGGLGQVLDFFGVDNDFAGIASKITNIGDTLVATSSGFDAAKEKILGWGNAASDAATRAQTATGAAAGLGTAVGALLPKKNIDISVNTGDAASKIGGIGDAVRNLPSIKDIKVTVNGQASASGQIGGTAVTQIPGGATIQPGFVNPKVVESNPSLGSFFDPTKNPLFPKNQKAAGGAIFGAGNATSDSIPAWLSNGEHVWTAREVNALGGQAAMYRLRSMVRGFDTGGAATSDDALRQMIMGARGNPVKPTLLDDDAWLELLLMRKGAIKGNGRFSGKKPLGQFNPGMRIDTSLASSSQGHNPDDPTSPGFDEWALTFGDISDITALDEVEKDRLFRPKGNRIQRGQDATYDWLYGYKAGGAVGGAVGNSAGYGTNGGGLVPGSAELRKIIMERFGISNIGGYRPADKYGEHSTGRALDVMVGKNGSQGDAVKDFALSNADAIDLKWVIWKQHLSTPGGGGYDMPDRGSPTANHMDHVHIFSGPGITNGLRGALAGAGPQVQAPALEQGPPVGDVAATPTALVGSSFTSGGGSGIPSSFSGLSSIGLDGLGVKTKVGANTPERSLDLGGVASAAVGGQVSSALGAFGINDSPPFLQAASKLISGISVGGHDPSGVSDGSIFNGANPLGSFGAGASAAPLSATSTSVGAPPPDITGDVHGSRAGQPPGDVYHIQTARVEDAFLQSERIKNEKRLAQVNRY